MAKHIGNIVGTASSDAPLQSISTTTNSAIWNKQEQFYFSTKSSWPQKIVSFVIELWSAKGANASCAGANGGYNKTRIEAFQGNEFTVQASNGRVGVSSGGSGGGLGGGTSGIIFGTFPSPPSNWLVVAGGGGGGGNGPWQCGPGSIGFGSGGSGVLSNGGNGPPFVGGGGAGAPGGPSGGLYGENSDGGGGGGGGYGARRNFGPNGISTIFPAITSINILESSDGTYSGLGSVRITYNGITTSYSNGVVTSFKLW
jgi:hypothetical protein